MVMRRPVCFFGAAFLLTVAAALTLPVLLFFLALPIAFALLYLPDSYREVAVALGVGCLTALLASGFFLVRLHRAAALVGSTSVVQGTIFYDGQQQLAAVASAGGGRALVRLFPPIEGAELGDCFQGKLAIRQALPSSDYFFQGRGVLLEALPPEALLWQEGEPPLFIKAMLLRERLCQGLLGGAPTSSAAVTAAVLFSYTDALSAPLREAFSRSGMGHLLAVSGLHLSILVWWLVGLVKRLRGGPWLQALVGTGSALFVFFAAGMTPSVLRATLMTLLTLAAGLVHRKSDGFTSLTLAAVLLVALCPPILSNLSFQLSFAAVLGILALAPRLSAALEQCYIARFSTCGRGARSLIGAASVSAGAQLATAPLVAFAFGRLPLLGLLINFIAIPLVYPVLLCGFAATLLRGTPAAVFLLKIAHFFSGLLGVVAAGASRLPFCSLTVLFPTDLLPVLPFALFCLVLPVLPLRRGFFGKLLGATLLLTLMLSCLQLWVARSSVLIASSSATGSLTLTYRGESVLVEGSASAYHRRLDARRLELLGTPTPQIILLPHPDEAPAHTAAVQDFYGLAPRQLYTGQQLAAPVPLLPGITARVTQPYLLEIQIGHTKLMKFFAVYDTIEPFNLPTGPLLLSDRPGNLLSMGGKPAVFRRVNGNSFTRIYMGEGGVQDAVYR